MNNFWFVTAVIICILLVSACSHIWYKTKTLLSEELFIFADVLILFETSFIGAACRALWNFHNETWNWMKQTLKVGSSSQEHLLRFVSLGWICSQSALAYCVLIEPREVYWFHMVSAFSHFTPLVTSGRACSESSESELKPVKSRF